MTEDMNTLEVLMKARALIAKPGGWCQKQAHDGVGYCARGALEAVQGTLASWMGLIYPPAHESGAVRALRAEVPLDIWGTHSITGFNDEEGRTKDEVLAAFDRAIEAEWEKVQGAAEPIEAVPA